MAVRLQRRLADLEPDKSRDKQGNAEDGGNQQQAPGIVGVLGLGEGKSGHRESSLLLRYSGRFPEEMIVRTSWAISHGLSRRISRIGPDSALLVLGRAAGLLLSRVRFS
jgi:hypothetical protein